MLNNLPIDEEQTRGSRNVVLQEDTANSMDGVSKQKGSLKKNGNRKNIYAQNWEEAVENPWAHEEGGLGKQL